jgi:hypothetical protein
LSETKATIACPLVASARPATAAGHGRREDEIPASAAADLVPFLVVHGSVDARERLRRAWSERRGNLVADRDGDGHDHAAAG